MVKIGMVKRFVATGFLMFGCALFAADGTWINRSGIGISPESPADWFDPANWTDGIIPNDWDSKANIDAAAGQYIALTNDVTVKDLRYEGTTPAPVLIGDARLTVRAQSESTAVYFWGDRYFLPIDFRTTSLNARCHGEICGPYGAYVMWFADKLDFRFDRWATDMEPVRTNPIRCLSGDPYLLDVEAQHHVTFYCPEGLDAPAVSSWRLTAGSSVLRRAAGSSKTHALPVGTAVLGEGIASGSFVKRIYDDDTIELSKPVSVSSQNADMTFSAFAPDIIQDFRYWKPRLHGYYKVEAARRRADDKIRIRFQGVDGSSSVYRFAIDTPVGYEPGVIEIGNRSNTLTGEMKLGNARLEFTTYYGGAVVTPGLPNFSVFVDDADATATLVATSGIAATVGRLSGLAGTLVKEGEGSLEIGFPANAKTSLKGAIVIREGTFAVRATVDGVNYIPTLTIKSGAVLSVPESGFTCDTLVAEEGAVVGGAGTLTYGTASEATLSNLVLRDKCRVVPATPVGGPLSVSVLDGTSVTYTQDGDDIVLVNSDAKIKVTGAGTLDLLVVAGGGGGGADRGGGGGGGGVIYKKAVSVEEGLYPVRVGSGGVGAPHITTGGRKHGGNGGDSYCFGETAVGGGGGGTRSSEDIGGWAGGSGGGAGAQYYIYSQTTMGGAGTTGQGCAGGNGLSTKDHWTTAGGGGGGVEQAGGSASADGVPGAGGNGRLCPIWGQRYYGGGGGGGGGDSGKPLSAGGLGGGGKGGSVDDKDNRIDGENGAANSGGGGGGGASYIASYFTAGGNGGSGIVILRYRAAGKPVQPLPTDPIAMGGDVRRRRGYMVHTFNGDGTFELMRDAFVDILLVGGGGGGGSSSGGGGGGGGVVTYTNLYLAAGTYPIVVGVGGQGAPSAGSRAMDGTDSFLVQPFAAAILSAAGGGGGGTRPKAKGYDGASGGGGGAGYYYNDTTGGYVGGSGLDGQGHVGGRSTNEIGRAYGSQGGGGGGAGTKGADAVSNAGGNGGDGVYVDFSGKVVCYGGGGGGGSAHDVSPESPYYAQGGLGGGGKGGGCAQTPSYTGFAGENGVDGLGGGGGGAGSVSDYSASGGKGGRGVVVIRYAVLKSGLTLIVR